MSLCLADKIMVCNEVLVTHKYHPTSLEATNFKSPECFYYALKQLKNKLEEQGIYDT